MWVLTTYSSLWSHLALGDRSESGTITRGLLGQEELDHVVHLGTAGMNGFVNDAFTTQQNEDGELIPRAAADPCFDDRRKSGHLPVVPGLDELDLLVFRAQVGHEFDAPRITHATIITGGNVDQSHC